MTAFEITHPLLDEMAILPLFRGFGFFQEDRGIRQWSSDFFQPYISYGEEEFPGRPATHFASVVEDKCAVYLKPYLFQYNYPTGSFHGEKIQGSLKEITSYYESLTVNLGSQYSKFLTISDGFNLVLEIQDALHEKAATINSGHDSNSLLLADLFHIPSAELWLVEDPSIRKILKFYSHDFSIEEFRTYKDIPVEYALKMR